MFGLIWLVVFALAGFSPVGTTIPGLTPNRMSRSISSPEEQIVVGKSSGIHLPTSRLPNWRHDSSTFTGDISIQKGATRNGDLNLPSKASPSPSVVAVDQARSQSNRLLFQKRQVCFPVCGSATVFPYDTFCCEEGQYCTTSNRTPLCAWSTSAESQTSSSTFSTTTDVTPISSSQTIDLSSATGGPSSTTEELPTTSSTITTIVTTPISTTQSSSAASDTQSSIGIVSTSSASKTYSPTSTTSSTTSSISSPSTSLAGGGGLDLGTIVGIVFGVVGAIGVVAGIIFGVRQWDKRGLGVQAFRDAGSWFCGCGRSHYHDEVPMGQYPPQNRYP